MKITVTGHDIDTTDVTEHNGRKGFVELGKRIAAKVDNGDGVIVELSFELGPFHPLYKEQPETAVLKTLTDLANKSMYLEKQTRWNNEHRGRE